MREKVVKKFYKYHLSK